MSNNRHPMDGAMALAGSKNQVQRIGGFGERTNGSG
jgi:hypothetical protein